MAVICLCRGTKSGGEALANALAERLGYPLLGREVLKEAALPLGISSEDLERRIFERPTMWSRFSVMRRSYVAALQAALAERVVEGNLVYHGLAGGVLLRGIPALLCVRIIAPMARRVETVAASSGMDPASAERYIREVDAGRARWVKVMYGEDILSPYLYDLLLNLDPMTLDTACAMTAGVALRPEYGIDDGVRAQLAEFRTACRVRMAFVTEPELRTLDLGVRVENGVVVITGEVPLHKSGRMGALIAERAKTVPGVDRVRLKVDWFDPYP